jgi:hypothetical protein
MWAVFYSVYDDPPVEKAGKAGKSRPRVDIIIQFNLQERPEYMFEAKRLRKKGFGVGAYISSEGMGCFINGLYASRYDEAAMLGYVQSDSVAYWREEIQKKIEEEAKTLSFTPPQEDVHIIEAFLLEWVSEHKRQNVTHPITIYHILLDCIVPPPPIPSTTSMD